MAKKFSELKATMSPGAQALASRKTAQMLAEMPLAELRHARRLSQEQLAEELHVRQPAIAKIEKKADMYISTLRRFIQAMGGDLEIRACFPEGSVKITQFEDLAQADEGVDSSAGGFMLAAEKSWSVPD